MKNLLKVIGILVAVFLVLFVISLFKGNPIEENSLLDQMSFKEMNTIQKTEVLNKIIQGKVEPYLSEHLNISRELNREIDIKKNMILWTGEIVDANNGLIKSSTYGIDVKKEDFGIVYLAKGKFKLITEISLDSLLQIFNNSYEILNDTK